MPQPTTRAGRAARIKETLAYRERMRNLSPEEKRAIRRAKAADFKRRREAKRLATVERLKQEEDAKNQRIADEVARLDAATIEGFVRAFLMTRYQNPQPIPDFHRDLWGLCCSEDRHVVAAAPRGFAKSTCVTHAYVLASLLFRSSRFVLIVSDTERQAMEFLGEIKAELQENESLIATFGVSKVLKDTESDMIVKMKDGHYFRVLAKGSEQKVRGLRWRGTRPDLIVGDDLENDEIVMNPDRREKFRNWVLKALLPAGSDNCLVRFVGTVLHFDSMLERFLNDANWKSLRFRAHADYDDFSELLWPEKFPASRLREIRRMYASQQSPEGYSQEYLNHPIEASSAFFRKSDFLPMDEADRKKRKTFYVLADFAISKSQRADSSAFAVVGVDEDGVMHVIDAYKDKLDSWQITEKVFELQSLWKPALFGIEEEKIKKAMGPFLNREMVRRGVYINFPDPPLVPSKDKKQRASAIQARMRAGGLRFDTQADWFPVLQEELLRFPRGAHDDYVDVLSWAGLLLDRMVDAPSDRDIEEEEWGQTFEYVGRSAICGY